MPKKKSPQEGKKRVDDSNVLGLHAEVLEQPITQTLELNYMPYAMSVIVSRAIPEIDGFKPSHRKLLYTMYDMGLLNKPRTKSANVVEYGFLEHCLREDLNEHAQRVMAVLHPVKLILTNYPEGQTETFEVENNPGKPEDGTRTVSFSRELWIEQEDFMEEPVKGYFRLFPGNEVRLKTAYVVRCTGCKKDADGNVIEVYAEYDPQTRGGNTPDGRKVKSTIHWADVQTAIDAEIRLYGNLFSVPDPDAHDFLEVLNPDSLEVLTGCKVEPCLAQAKPGQSFQFMRQGYFCADNRDSTQEHPVFNRSVSLKDGFKRKS